MHEETEELLEIVNHFGIKNQLKKFNEEQFELIQAIREYEETYFVPEEVKELKPTTRKIIEKEMLNNYNHVIEELADCYVLLAQIRNYYHINTQSIDFAMSEKVHRTLKRIEEGYYK